MSPLFIYAVIALFIVAGVFFAMWKFAAKAKKDMKEELENALEANKALMKQLSLLHEETKIKTENRKEADEKIEELHNGDALGNALNWLHRHKN